MASTSIVDVVSGVLDDDQVRDSFRRAALSGRDAVLQATGRAKPAKKTSALRRAGDSLQQAGRGLAALSGRAQKEEKKRSKTPGTLPVALGVAAAAAGVAAVLTRNSGGTQTTTGGTNG